MKWIAFIFCLLILTTGCANYKVKIKVLNTAGFEKLVCDSNIGTTINPDEVIETVTEFISNLFEDNGGLGSGFHLDSDSKKRFDICVMILFSREF